MIPDAPFSRTIQPVLPGNRLRIRIDDGLSDEEFWELCRRNPDLRIERDADGTLILMPPTGGHSGIRNSRLTRYMDEWAEQDQRGFSFDSNTMFELPNGANRMPDGAWIEAERFLSLSSSEQKGIVPLAPDFVIELRSPSDSLADLKDKMLEYVENGVRLGWLIDPRTETVTIYREDGTSETLDEPDRITADAVVDGFSLDLTRIWDPTASR